MDLPVLLGLVLGAIGTGIGVINLVLRLVEKSHEKPDLRIQPSWGYFQEQASSTGVKRGYASVYMEIYADNRGKRDTTIKRVIGTVPAEGGGEMIADGKSVDSDAIPIVVRPGSSILLRLMFDFEAGSARFVQDWITPAGRAMGGTARRLETKFSIVHVYGTEYARYSAYSKDSIETKFSKHLSISTAIEDNTKP